MIFLPFTKKRVVRSILKLNIKCHNSSCLLFPSDELVKKGGAQFLSGWSHVEQIRQWAEEIIKLAPKCGWSQHRTGILIDFWKLGKTCLSLIQQPVLNKPDISDQAARCFYFICIASWHWANKSSTPLNMWVPGSIQPLMPALKVSGIEELWHEENIDQTIRNIEQFVGVLAKDSNNS